jgi:hypothetical protein
MFQCFNTGTTHGRQFGKILGFPFLTELNQDCG